MGCGRLRRSVDPREQVADGARIPLAPARRGEAAFIQGPRKPGQGLMTIVPQPRDDRGEVGGVGIGSGLHRINAGRIALASPAERCGTIGIPQLRPACLCGCEGFLGAL